MQFIGREHELAELRALYQRKSASMVILQGRRRIGKSRLIEQFAKDETFFVFSGLPPTQDTTRQSQLDEFARQLHLQTGLPEVRVDDWSKLFLLLMEKIKHGRIVVLFDEISWMGSKDPDFLGKLKNAWDLHFKKNTKLILVLCGSVSSWIEKNIIRNTGFVGRPALYMTLRELSLRDCNKFWPVANQASSFEKLKLLSVTGGVPRYLELINPKLSAEQNIKQLCFSRNAPLFFEFEHIFSDIFSKRSAIYKKIIEQLVKGPMMADELADLVKLTRTGTFDDYLNDLVLAGFVARDFTWHLHTGEISKLSRFRLKDNYVRFYLKYISPIKSKIDKGSLKDVQLTSFPGWDGVMGLQFENLVLNNHAEILQQIGVSPSEVVVENPFFQRPTLRQPGCQIDYLVQTRFDTVYACEVKFSKHPIGLGVILEMKEKLERLKVPRNMSRRAVLIHVNGVTDELLNHDYFYKIIDFSEMF